MSSTRKIAAAALAAAALLAGAGWWLRRDPGAKPTVANDLAQTLSLAADLPFAELTVPDHSRAHTPVAPDQIPLTRWHQRGDVWVAPLPVRMRTFYFTKPLAGMRVIQADGSELPHSFLTSNDKPSWTYDEKTIQLHGISETPTDASFTFEYPSATARERALNYASSGAKAYKDFVRSTAQGGDATSGYDSRTGLLLPAPATASWDLTIPPAAELRFTPELERPEVLDAPTSDGASIVVTLEIAGEKHDLWTGQVSADQGDMVRVDLDAWAGQQGRLTIHTDPGADARFDYVFLADPVVSSRKESPRHIVLVFVDTLRPDHLSAYGYDRDTSPALKQIAAEGVRFDQARSVAPWTLPSARTMMTGRDPEAFFSGGTLPGALGRAGWATAMLAGNLYLGPNFGLNRDWGTHFVELLPHAETQVDRALAWLDAQSGRDAFVLVHLMDSHLPYHEPADYQTMWAKDRPASLRQGEFFRAEAAALKTKPDRQYIRDRYDSSIRYADDQLARLYARLGPDDAVMFVSDHGEEFWEHGGYEHGHALWDELLHIPMILRAPGLPAGTTLDAPVSMLDVAPTIAAIAGVPLPDAKGVSLLDAAKGTASAVDGLRARDQAFGRPLYGAERWGVLHQGDKYQTAAGRELLFNLEKDPVEKENLLDRDRSLREPMRGYLGQALGREVVVAYRLSNAGQRRAPPDALDLVLHVPGGIRAAWVADEPTEASDACIQWEPGSDTVQARWTAGWRGDRVVWVVPNNPMAEVTPDLTVDVSSGHVRTKYTIPADAPAELSAPPVPLLDERTGERGWNLGFGVTPIPLDGGVNLSGYDEETAGLAAMGYVVGDEQARVKSECGAKKPAPHAPK